VRILRNIATPNSSTGSRLKQMMEDSSQTLRPYIQ